MAYQINRKAHVVDEIHLEDNGKELTVKVDLQVERILRDYNAAWAKIGLAQVKIREVSGTEHMDEAEAALGEAIMALFALLFGEEQVRAIMDFYGGAYLEMLADFVPYISEKIVPAVQKAQTDLAAKYKQWSR
jgi:hypothetical protein